MKRIVWIVRSRSAIPVEPPAQRPEEPSSSDLIVDENKPGGAPIALQAALIEEDLMPLADPSHGKAYWQQVSLLAELQLGTAGARRPGQAHQRNRPRTVQAVSGNGRAQLIENRKKDRNFVTDQ